MIRGILAGLATGLACLFWAAEPVSAQSELSGQTLSRDEGRQLAARLIDANQPAPAREILRALLQADPQDIGTLLLIARAERLMGNFDVARQAARAAYAFATTEPEKFAAAVMVAQVLAADDRPTAAQFWLRRADNHAQTETAARLVAQDFQRLRAQNPLGLRLSFGASPSDNLNNGSANKTTTFEGLPFVFVLSPDALPLSGVEYSIDAGLSYRLQQTDQSLTTLDLGVYAKAVTLSPEAQASAPTVSNADFALAQVTGTLTHRWAPQGSTDPFNSSLSINSALYAGTPYSTGLSLGFGRDWTLEDDSRLSWTATVNQTRYLEKDEATLGTNTTLTWTKPLASQDTMTLQVGLFDVRSDAYTRRLRGWSTQVGYDFGAVGKAITLDASLGLNIKDFERSLFSLSPRTDQSVTLSVDVGLPNLSLYGFDPVVTFEHVATSSTEDLFDTRVSRVGLSLQTSF